jgi:hypothetical protein
MNSQRGSSRRGRGASSSSGRDRGTSSSSSRVRRGRGHGRGSYYNRSNGATSRNSPFRAQRQPSVTPSTASRLTNPGPFNNSRQPSSAPSAVYRQPPASVTPSQPRDNFDGNVRDESLDEIVMAVDMKPRGTVGCAYYVAAQEKLYFMEDIELGGPDVIEARKSSICSQSCSPLMIYQSRRSSTLPSFLCRLKSTMQCWTSLIRSEEIWVMGTVQHMACLPCARLALCPSSPMIRPEAGLSTSSWVTTMVQESHSLPLEILLPGLTKTM